MKPYLFDHHSLLVTTNILADVIIQIPTAETYILVHSMLCVKMLAVFEWFRVLRIQ